MDNNKIEKLLNTDLNSGDNLLGKSFLLKKYPEIKDKFSEKPDNTKLVYKKDVEKLGFRLDPGKHILQFDKDYFPELYK